MGHLSRNEVLRELRKENERLRERVAELEAKNQKGDAADFDFTVDELEQFIENIDNKDKLLELRGHEEQTKARKTALKVIDNRIEALSNAD